MGHYSKQTGMCFSEVANCNLLGRPNEGVMYAVMKSCTLRHDGQNKP